MNTGLLVATQNPLIISDGLIGYWSMNDYTGTVARDFSGNARNGTLQGRSTVPTWCDGKVGGGLTFNQANEVSVTVGDTVAASYSVWVYLTGTQQDYACVMSKNETGTRYFTIMLRTSIKLALYAYASGNVAYDNSGIYIIPLNTWTHIAMTYSSSDGLKGYINGMLDGSAAANGNLTMGATSLRIGSYYPEYTNRYVLGNIDQARLYNRVLTQAEVRTIYNTEGSEILADASLVAHYSFENPASVQGTTIYDLTGNGNNGTVNGSMVYTANANTGNFNVTSGTTNITCTNTNLRNLPSPTICFWANYTGGSGTAGIYVANGNSGARSFQVGVYNNSGGHTGLAFYSVSTGEYFSSNVASVTGWHFWTVSLPANQIKWYIDGALINTTTGTPSNTGTTAGTVLELGQDFYGTYMRGQMQGLYIYNRVLSDTEVMYNYNRDAWRFAS